jgi:peptidoglycan LD-endopeptidase LytH
MKNTILLLAIGIIIHSCNVSAPIISDKKTPHEKYEKKLKNGTLADSEEGKKWLEASEKALLHPVAIQLPYQLTGTVRTDKPRALALEFRARLGELVNITVSQNGPQNFIMYSEVFFKNEGEALHSISSDTAGTQFSFMVEETGSYKLKLQSELFKTGSYTVSVSAGPSLGFPVSGKARVGSFWGDSRDGGKRSHEGIDIFAAKLTPVIAIADGTVTSVNNGGLGGKTVSIHPHGTSLSLYYAHLDKQLVKEGQQVKKGDKIGLVGNTGNAKHTPAHLHFGIYTFAGAVDPLPFVKQQTNRSVPVSDKGLPGKLKLVKQQKTRNGEIIKANTLLIPLAVSQQGYLAELPDGQLIEAGFASVKPD